MALEIKYSLEDFNKGRIIDKYGLQEGGSTELFLANTCFRRMEKYTPRDTGTMATTVTIKPGKIIYDTDYAYYQYRGYTNGPVKHYSHNSRGLRGKEWDKKMKINEGHLVAKEVENHVKKISKG